jgi:hypothetical protein
MRVTTGAAQVTTVRISTGTCAPRAPHGGGNKKVSEREKRRREEPLRVVAMAHAPAQNLGLVLMELRPHAIARKRCDVHEFGPFVIVLFELCKRRISRLGHRCRGFPYSETTGSAPACRRLGNE